MPTKGRSADDLPLAAYLTGVDPATEPVRDPEPVVPPAEPQGASQGAPDGLARGPFDYAVAQPTQGEGEVVAPPPGTLVGRARAFYGRNPRLVGGGAFVTMIVVGLMLLTGGQPGPSAAGATPSPSAPPTVTIAAEPGEARLVLTGSLDATYSLIGAANQPVVGNALTATWADPLQNVLTLNGPVDRGTRTTGAGLVLTWGLMVDGELVTFTSNAGECTIGMAVLSNHVTGSFTCKKIKSDNGKLTIRVSGTYRT